MHIQGQNKHDHNAQLSCMKDNIVILVNKVTTGTCDEGRRDLSRQRWRLVLKCIHDTWYCIMSRSPVLITKNAPSQLLRRHVRVVRNRTLDTLEEILDRQVLDKRILRITSTTNNVNCDLMQQAKKRKLNYMLWFPLKSLCGTMSRRKMTHGE